MRTTVAAYSKLNANWHWIDRCLGTQWASPARQACTRSI
jgi:hypothetical protein